MDYKWEIIGKLKDKSSKLKAEDIIDLLLKNRSIKTAQEKKEFFNPTPPEKITVRSLGLSLKDISKAIKRLQKARKGKEKVIIYGDYDADGICASAILWECLYGLGLDVMPYIPKRFSEGYGLNVGSVEKLKAENPKLKVIITVDNGIVAYGAIDKANELGIDVIVTDHHQKGSRKNRAYSIIYTDRISGAGIAWVFTREIRKKLKAESSKLKVGDGLDLVAIGTIADQSVLLGANRSFVKYGLESLRKTKRPGLIALFEEAGLDGKKVPNSSKVRNLDDEFEVGVYEVGFVIAPRINAMGRLEHALDSLRLLCTTSKNRARDLALILGKTNKERQRIVGEVLIHTKSIAEKREWKGVIVVAHESYHEGVIGLAASKLVEEFYRPAIVISQGEKIAKASARSISGFDIIAAIRQVDDLLLEGGGHPMAAGFSIKTDKIDEFSRRIDRISKKLLTEEVLSKKHKIDLELDLDDLNPTNSNLGWDLIEQLKQFEPTGIGNPTPSFASEEIDIVDVRTVGFENRHLKLTLGQNSTTIDAIAFGYGEMYQRLISHSKIDVAYNFEENVWNGDRRMQLKVKDIKIRNK